MSMSQQTLQESTTSASAGGRARARQSVLRQSAVALRDIHRQTGSRASAPSAARAVRKSSSPSPTSPAGGTRVTGSSYLFDMQVARFFSTLPPVDAA